MPCNSIRVLTLTLWAAYAAAYLDIAFNSSHTFGPDGPWYGIQFDVAYVYTGASHYSVSLLPSLPGSVDGTGPAAWIPMQGSCAVYSGQQPDCGEGGFIPVPSSEVTQYGLWYNYIQDGVAGYIWNCSGPLVGMSLSSSGSFSMSGAYVGAANQSYVKYPSGVTAGLELGFLSLGSGNLKDYFGGYDNPPFYAYNQSLTESDTWNLHVGAAALGYPGSLVFGGYDKGRAVGPALEFTSVDESLIIGLRDVILGVEVGESPFSFNEQSGLLVPATETDGSVLAAGLYPQFPYIALPQATINEIVKELPVYYQNGYYLWDTTSPNYTKIVSSSAYLGFVLSSVGGDGANVTIKVPFPLLNLTLETSASGADKNAQYFPLVQADVPTPGSGGALLMGRAFLQAAYIGSNWQSNASWIAQAAGPGTADQGLGSNLVDLPTSATTLELESGDTAFQNSWSGHWTVSSSSSGGGSSGSGSGSGSSGSSGSASGSGHSSSGLSGGAIAGIVVGVVALIAIIASIFFLKRRKSRSRKISEMPDSQRAAEKPYVYGSELQTPHTQQYSELHSPQNQQWSEMDGKDQRRELPAAVHPVHELAGS